MKKVALVVVIIGLMAGGMTSFAQDASTPPPKGEKHQDLTPQQKAEKKTKKMTEDLGLSATQAKTIGDLNKKQAEEMEAIHAKMKALKDEAKAKRDAYDKEVDKVLTADQRVILAKQKADRKAKHDAHKPAGGRHH